MIKRAWGLARRNRQCEQRRVHNCTVIRGAIGLGCCLGFLQATRDDTVPFFWTAQCYALFVWPFTLVQVVNLTNAIEGCFMQVLTPHFLVALTSFMLVGFEPISDMAEDNVYKAVITLL